LRAAVGGFWYTAWGRTLSCVSDNRTELTGMAILRWCQAASVKWHYIAPGKPQQNAFQAVAVA
jgi:transposase InsO family protein